MKITGIIKKGTGQASQDFQLPTANIHIDALPDGISAGVYASKADVDGQNYNGLTFIGQAHLIEGQPWRCETHLFQVSGDFTGKELRLQLLQLIRPSMPFTSTQQAVEVIKNDVAAALTYFKQQSA